MTDRKLYLAMLVAIIQPAVGSAQSLTVVPPNPTWNGSSTYQHYGISENTNNFPSSSKFGYGVGPLIEGITAGVDTSSTSTAINSSGVAGYSRCNGGSGSVFTNCVGIFGAGLLGASSASSNGQSGGAWGINALAVNAPASQSGNNAGFDFGFLGNELDVNVLAKAGGAVPAGNAVGLLINGASQIAPSGNFDAIQIAAAGAPWSSAILLGDGVATYAFWDAPATKTGASGSMPLILDSRTTAGRDVQATIASDTAGNVIVTPNSPSNGGYFQVNGGVKTSYIYAVGTLPTCGNSLIFFRTFVNDASSSTYQIGAAVSGGGTGKIPVYCNGTSWVAG